MALKLMTREELLRAEADELGPLAEQIEKAYRIMSRLGLLAAWAFAFLFW